MKLSLKAVFARCWTMLMVGAGTRSREYLLFPSDVRCMGKRSRPMQLTKREKWLMEEAAKYLAHLFYG